MCTTSPSGGRFIVTSKGLSCCPHAASRQVAAARSPALKLPIGLRHPFQSPSEHSDATWTTSIRGNSPVVRSLPAESGE